VNRLQGIALFACIPLVLWLFLGQPLGPAASLALGLAIMIAHRFVAAPWVVRRASTRCLWCGRDGAALEPVAVADRRGVVTAFGACGAAHAASIRRFFGYVRRRRVPIGLGILVPLAVLLGGTFARVLGVDVLSPATAAIQFRVFVAATVVTVSLRYRRAEPDPASQSVFPVHNLALLGVRTTLWIFRMVGAWWLLSVAWRLAAPGQGQ
jgi:hypothetical protein